MAYVWRNGNGTTRDVEPEPEPDLPIPEGHGTPAGYHAHYRAGDRGLDICHHCREARNAKKRELRAAQGLKPGPKATYGTGCGSPAGYTTHTRHGERPCDPCRAAYNARKVEYIAGRRAATTRNDN